MSLPMPNAGEPISAAHVRALSEQVARLNRDVAAMQTLVRAAIKAQAVLVRGIVTAVNGATVISGAAPAVDLRTVTYDVQPVGGTDENKLLAVKPDFGRPWYVPAGGGSVVLAGVPAAVGETALIIYANDGAGAFEPKVLIAERLMAGEPCDPEGGA